MEAQLAQKKDLLNRPDFKRLSQQSPWNLWIVELRKQVPGEHVSKGWLKCFEMLNLPQVKVQLSQLPAVVFCNAELPGSFVYAINHFYALQGKHPNFLLASYMQGLPDSYNLLKNHPEFALTGTITTNKGVFEVNGDLTQPRMPKIISTLAKSKHPNIYLYTSDGGFDVDGGQENQQEELSIPLKYGEFQTGLLSLAKSGVAIIKIFNFFTPTMQAMIDLAGQCFQKWEFYKPQTSNPTNGEIYFIGINFKGGSLPPLEELSYSRLNDQQCITKCLTEHVHRQLHAVDLFLKMEVPPGEYNIPPSIANDYLLG